MYLHFYIYAYYGKNGLPYYIGKGSRNRAWQTHSNIRKPKDKSKIVILFSNLSEGQAWDLETKLIEKYGRKDLGNGSLENKSNGGEGSSGKVFSASTRLAMSESAKQRWADPKKSKSLRLERKTRTRASVEKIKASVTNLWKTHDYIEKQKHSRAQKSYKEILSIKAKNREKFQCPHCKGLFQPSHLSRWHGINCKLARSVK